jgi:hypothetical protein
MPNCIVCGSEKSREDMHVITLTEAERQLLAESREEYVYCQPCWRVLSDPATAPALMSGIARHRLRQAGVDNADQLANKFRQDLAARAITRRS